MPSLNDTITALEQLAAQAPFFTPAQFKPLFPPGTKTDIVRAAIHRSPLRDWPHRAVRLPKKLQLRRVDGQLAPIGVYEDGVLSSSREQVLSRMQMVFPKSDSGYENTRVYFVDAEPLQQMRARSSAEFLEWLKNYDAYVSGGPVLYIAPPQIDPALLVERCVDEFSFGSPSAARSLVCYKIFTWLALTEVLVDLHCKQTMPKNTSDWWIPNAEGTTQGLPMAMGQLAIATGEKIAVVCARNLNAAQFDDLHLRLTMRYDKYILY